MGTVNSLENEVKLKKEEIKLCFLFNFIVGHLESSFVPAVGAFAGTFQTFSKNPNSQGSASLPGGGSGWYF